VVCVAIAFAAARVASMATIRLQQVSVVRCGIFLTSMLLVLFAAGKLLCGLVFLNEMQTYCMS
jgi:hypothetical protein